MNKDKKIKFNTLQLVRGIAAILVVLAHGLVNTDLYKYVINISHSAIDLFFVLSGFILFYVHYHEIGVKSKLKQFLIKRTLRIYPLYWMITIIYIAIVIPLGSSFSFEYILKSLLLLPQQQMPILGVAWFLEYEILLYVIFSLIIFNRKLFFPILAIWCLSIALFTLPSLQANSLFINRISNPINLDFLYGAGIALLVRKNKLAFKWVPKIAIIVGILGICLSSTLISLELWKIHRGISWGIPSAFLIFGLVKLEINQKVRIPKISVFLGNASYSIYLSHLISLLIFSKLIERIGLFFNLARPNVFGIISCVSAVLVGCLFHAFVEKPLTKYFTDNIIKIHAKRTQTSATM